MIEIKIESTRIHVKCVYHNIIWKFRNRYRYFIKYGIKTIIFAHGFIATYNTISIFFIGFLSTRDTYHLLLASGERTTLCIKKRDTTHLKTEKNSAKSSHKLSRKKLPRYMLPFLRRIVSSTKGGDKRRISQRLRPFLTVVSRWANFLQTLINRGKHVWAVILLYVDDERMNFNLVEKLQGCVFFGISLPRKRSDNDFCKNFTSIQFGYENENKKSWKNYTNERLE